MTDFPNYPAVLRFPVAVGVGEYTEFEVPTSHTVRSVAPGRSSLGYPLDVWIECNPSHHNTNLRFKVVGTGHASPNSPLEHWTFLGTCVNPDDLVWHVYYREVDYYRD